MNEEVIEEKSHKIRDETEKVSKRWKVGRRNKTKKKIDVKDLENEWYNVDKKEDIQQKIIDMRGPETVYIENMARGEKKTGVLAEFLLILKVDYEGKKHKLHGTLRKQRYELDSVINAKFEGEELRNEMKKLSLKQTFYKEIKEIFETIVKKETSIEQVIEFFKEISQKYKEETMEHELFLYLIKSFCEKSKNFSMLPFEDYIKIFKDYSRFYKYL